LLGPPTAPGVIPLGHFRMAFLLMGALSLLGALDVVGLEPAAGNKVRLRRPA